MNHCRHVFRLAKTLCLICFRTMTAKQPAMPMATRTVELFLGHSNSTFTVLWHILLVCWCKHCYQHHLACRRTTNCREAKNILSLSWTQILFFLTPFLRHHAIISHLYGSTEELIFSAACLACARYRLYTDATAPAPSPVPSTSLPAGRDAARAHSTMNVRAARHIYICGTLILYLKYISG